MRIRSSWVQYLVRMAPAVEDTEQDDEVDSKAAKPVRNGAQAQESEEEDEGDEEEEEEEEPRLEYVSMTKKLTAVYRNGGATSTFLVAGDKMVRMFRRYTYRSYRAQARC